MTLQARYDGAEVSRDRERALVEAAFAAWGER